MKKSMNANIVSSDGAGSIISWNTYTKKSQEIRIVTSPILFLTP